MSAQSHGLWLNIRTPGVAFGLRAGPTSGRSIHYATKRQRRPRRGRREGNRRARLSWPFPYAGMTQFRFEGLFSVRLSPDTPNGDRGTVRQARASVKTIGLTRRRTLGYSPRPFGPGSIFPPNWTTTAA